MQFPLFGLSDGPEWERSVREAEEEALASGGDLKRFEANQAAARDALQYDPRGYSDPFLGGPDGARVFTTRDDAEGYRLVVFFEIKGDRSERKWLMLEWL